MTFYTIQRSSQRYFATDIPPKRKKKRKQKNCRLYKLEGIDRIWKWKLYLFLFLSLLFFLDKKEIEMEIFVDIKQIGTCIWLTISFDFANVRNTRIFSLCNFSRLAFNFFLKAILHNESNFFFFLKRRLLIC